MRNVALPLLFLMFFLFQGAAFSQMFSEKEKQVFKDWAALFSKEEPNWKAPFGKADKEIAEKYGMTVEQVQDIIVVSALTKFDEEEEKIFREVAERIRGGEKKEEIYKDISSRFDVSVEEISSIIARRSLLLSVEEIKESK